MLVFIPSRCTASHLPLLCSPWLWPRDGGCSWCVANEILVWCLYLACLMPWTAQWLNVDLPRPFCLSLDATPILSTFVYPTHLLSCPVSLYKPTSIPDSSIHLLKYIPNSDKLSFSCTWCMLGCLSDSNIHSDLSSTLEFITLDSSSGIYLFTCRIVSELTCMYLLLCSCVRDMPIWFAYPFVHNLPWECLDDSGLNHIWLYSRLFFLHITLLLNLV